MRWRNSTNKSSTLDKVSSQLSFTVLSLLCGSSLVFNSAGMAQQSEPVAAQTSTSKQGVTQNVEEPEQLRKTIKRLNAEVDRLRKRIAVLEKFLQTAGVQERLSKEEQRA